MLEELGYDKEIWTEITYDTNAEAKPDIVGDLLEIDKHIEPNTIDAIIANHVIEHVHDWDVTYVLDLLKKCLVDDGVLIVTVPNAIRMCEEVIKTKSLRTKLFEAPSGPIRALDMLYGHQHYAQVWKDMEHKTAFTPHDLIYIGKQVGLKATHLGYETDEVGFRMVFKKDGN
jgi:predicted SAM-dependent methyltransferase